MSQDDLIQQVQQRIDKARQLAAQTTDAKTREALLVMAQEGEDDLARLRAERGVDEPPPAGNPDY